MKGFLLFDFEKLLFAPRLLSKLRYEVEILYVNFVGVLDVSFWEFSQSLPYLPALSSALFKEKYHEMFFTLPHEWAIHIFVLLYKNQT